jgi:hypothetical protein
MHNINLGTYPLSVALVWALYNHLAFEPKRPSNIFKISTSFSRSFPNQKFFQKLLPVSSTSWITPGYLQSNDKMLSLILQSLSLRKKPISKDGTPPSYEAIFNNGPVQIRARDTPQWTWSNAQCREWLTAVMIDCSGSSIEKQQR